MTPDIYDQFQVEGDVDVEVVVFVDNDGCVDAGVVVWKLMPVAGGAIKA